MIVEAPVAAAAEKEYDLKRLVDCVRNGRKDELLIDFSRIIGPHYARMVQALSDDQKPFMAHNNKVLFLEAIDYWCRKMLMTPRAGTGETEDPRVVVDRVMSPWYEALALEKPAEYRVKRCPPPPVYVGTPEDALCLELGLAACLDITPMMFRFGGNEGKPEHIWGVVQADGNWYDTDISEPLFVLGDFRKFKEYDEQEIPL